MAVINLVSHTHTHIHSISTFNALIPPHFSDTPVPLPMMQSHTLPLHSMTSSKSNPKKSQRSSINKSQSVSHKSARQVKLVDDGATDRNEPVVDKTVYETAGIVDRLDRLKAKVESELTKEASKSKWFSECQRSIEDKKVLYKPKSDTWSMGDRMNSSPLPPVNNSAKQKLPTEGETDSGSERDA